MVGWWWVFRLTGQYTPGVITAAGWRCFHWGAQNDYVLAWFTQSRSHETLKFDPRPVSLLSRFGNWLNTLPSGLLNIWVVFVKCVSYWDGKDKASYTISKETDWPHFLKSITDQYGAIDKEKATAAGYSIEDGGAWISKEVDVLIPAALEGQLNAETVHKIHPKVKIIAEGANGPTTPDADKVIKERGILWCPISYAMRAASPFHILKAYKMIWTSYWTKEEAWKS